MNKIPIYRLLLTFVTFLVISTTLGGCASLPESLYKTYSLKHGDVGFSFEYPAYYTLVSKYAPSDPSYGVKMLFTRTKQVKGYSDNFFEVYIGGPSIDEALSGTNDFVELERYTTIVAGMPADFVAFSSTGISNIATVTRVVIFQVGSKYWRIALGSEEAGAAQNKLDFEHIVNSFKILL